MYNVEFVTLSSTMEQWFYKWVPVLFAPFAKPRRTCERKAKKRKTTS